MHEDGVYDMSQINQGGEGQEEGKEEGKEYSKYYEKKK